MLKFWFCSYWQNQVTHGSAKPSVKSLVITVTRKTKAHWLSINQTWLTRASPSKIWKPPDAEWLKINVDAAFSNGVATSGLIIRNHNGSIILAASHQHSCLDSNTTETLAILDACKLLANINCSKAFVESDCLIAIATLKGDSMNWYWSATPVLHQIIKLWKDWPSWNFKFTRRSANGAAHALTKWAFNCIIIFEGCIPLDSLPL
ncbi:hypothetical protein CASFOL_013131 [Castilleja foliolosa]|uniref:RNase H type-1 domain-containing protein n=1 Tax=Castilleja foliolosa TaxID=1961234 RepID=A0ABD3DKZ8_9LAMI